MAAGRHAWSSYILPTTTPLAPVGRRGDRTTIDPWDFPASDYISLLLGHHTHWQAVV